jgi:hypothetical protein
LPDAQDITGSVTQQLLHVTGRPVLALPPTRVAHRSAVRVPAGVGAA